MRKKILQINCSSYGSTGRLVAQLHKQAEGNQFDSYVAYGYGDGRIPGSYRISNWFDIRLHDRLSSLLCMQGEFSVLTTLRLLKYISNVRPDVVHLHNLHGNYLNYPLLFDYLGRMGKPILWTLHDCWAFTGKCPHFSEVRCDKWKSECSHCPQLHRYPASYFIDNTAWSQRRKRKFFILPTSMKIIAVSEWLRGVAEESFLAKYPIEVIPNGVDTRVFKPTPSSIRDRLGIGDKTMILGVASNLGKSKGLEDFVALSRVIDRETVIVLVGIRDEVKQSLPDNIIGISGNQSAQQLVELYSSASMLLNLSKEETFGLVVVEAMACGTPSIVYNSTACPELVDPSTGLVIEPDDARGLVEALRRIQAIGKAGYSEACVRKARADYEIANSAAAYFAEYERLGTQTRF